MIEFVVPLVAVGMALGKYYRAGYWKKYDNTHTVYAFHKQSNGSLVLKAHTRGGVITWGDYKKSLQPKRPWGYRSALDHWMDKWRIDQMIRRADKYSVANAAIDSIYGSITPKRSVNLGSKMRLSGDITKAKAIGPAPSRPAEWTLPELSEPSALELPEPKELEK